MARPQYLVPIVVGLWAVLLLLPSPEKSSQTEQTAESGSSYVDAAKVPTLATDTLNLNDGAGRSPLSAKLRHTASAEGHGDLGSQDPRDLTRKVNWTEPGRFDLWHGRRYGLPFLHQSVPGSGRDDDECAPGLHDEGKF